MICLLSRRCRVSSGWETRGRGASAARAPRSARSVFVSCGTSLRRRRARPASSCPDSRRSGQNYAETSCAPRMKTVLSEGVTHYSASGVTELQRARQCTVALTALRLGSLGKLPPEADTLPLPGFYIRARIPRSATAATAEARFAIGVGIEGAGPTRGSGHRLPLRMKTSSTGAVRAEGRALTAGWRRLKVDLLERIFEGSCTWHGLISH